MESIFDYKYENGKVVKVEKKYDAKKQKMLVGRTESFLRTLILMC